jgi:quaternary ammonium compound-resistance protein SugE
VLTSESASTPGRTRRTRSGQDGETVWAAALGASKGFSRAVPAAVFLVALVLSMSGLAYALREIPLGTGYAIWVGIGTVGTA